MIIDDESGDEYRRSKEYDETKPRYFYLQIEAFTARGNWCILKELA
ncbi:MAG: hypothetical protein WKF59_06400 [Chitinophagaceae bacterium]